MSKTEGAKRALKVGDDSVKARTGKAWAGWYAILDAAGAPKLDHKGIVAILREKHGVGSWWQQMIAVGYEQERGMRELHQGPKGYAASASKTCNVPVLALFKAWENKTVRARWLTKPDFEIRKATPGKSMRITWVDKKTNLDVGFFPKGSNKSQVAIEHSKLPDAKSVARMKTFWSKALATLKTNVEA
jgi:hypothetical protein